MVLVRQSAYCNCVGVQRMVVRSLISTASLNRLTANKSLEQDYQGIDTIRWFGYHPDHHLFLDTQEPGSSDKGFVPYR